MTAGRAGNRLNGYGPNAVITLHPRPLVVVALLAAFLLLPSMATIGMFMDGTIYAAISRNLAEGVGTMWALHFSAGLFPVFREHPPLVFWLQSFFFRLLGDGYRGTRCRPRLQALPVEGALTPTLRRLRRNYIASRGKMTSAP